MNMQHNLIQELRLYMFKLDHNSTEVSKNICFAKGEGAVDHSTVTKWSKKFGLSWKNLNYQTRPGRPRTMHSKAMLQEIWLELEEPQQSDKAR